jgi:hypothetical protein
MIVHHSIEHYCVARDDSFILVFPPATYAKLYYGS